MIRVTYQSPKSGPDYPVRRYVGPLDAHVTELDGGFFVMTESGRRLMSLSRNSHAIDKEPGVTAAEMEACAWALASKLLRVDERAGGAGSQAPGALRWTKEKPTREGWYWYRQAANQRGITEVYPCFGRFLMFAGDGSSIDLVKDAEWAGPIPEPAAEGPAGGAL